MYSAHVDYYRPTSVAEAVELLSSNEGAKLLAGGHSLIPSMKLRVVQPTCWWISVASRNYLASLWKVTHSGSVRSPHIAIATSPDVKTHCAILAEAAALIADQQVRNRGTIGGSSGTSRPRLRTIHPRSRRWMRLSQLLAKWHARSQPKISSKICSRPALAEDEVLTMITVPPTGKCGRRISQDEASRFRFCSGRCGRAGQGCGWQVHGRCLQWAVQQPTRTGISASKLRSGRNRSG